MQQQQINKHHYDINRRDPHYKVDDKFLIRIHGIRGELDPKFSPIPQVIPTTNHPTYLVQDIQT
ncbi:unnamed protein product, partial [Rotaria magnacalcarata]